MSCHPECSEGPAVRFCCCPCLSFCHPRRGSAVPRSGTTLPASLNRDQPRPNLRPPKQRDPDIPMHLQRVAFGRHRPPVCMSRLRIVNIPIHQVIRICGPKLRPNHQPTQRPPSQRSIRILRIDRRRRRRLQLHDLHAALRPTRIHPHHRPRSRLPIPIHPTRRISKPTPPNHRQNPKPSHHLSDASTVQTCHPDPERSRTGKDLPPSEPAPSPGGPFIAQHFAR